MRMGWFLGLIGASVMVGCGGDDDGSACFCGAEVPGGRLSIACGSTQCVDGAGYRCVGPDDFVSDPSACAPSGDAGPPPMDAGPGDVDAGPADTDAGPPPADAGPGSALAARAVLVGSVLFLPAFEPWKTIGVWLFILGAGAMLVGALGQFFVNLGEGDA